MHRLHFSVAWKRCWILSGTSVAYNSLMMSSAMQNLLRNMLKEFVKFLKPFSTMESILDPRNCSTVKSSMCHLVSTAGVQIDPKHLDAILSLKSKTPQSIDDVRRLLGFLSYYRVFIQDFSRVAKPMYELLQVKAETLPANSS